MWDRMSTDRRSTLEAVGCGLVFFALYLSTLSRNHIEAEDGLRYANDIASGDPARVSNPYHLAYGWLGRSASALADASGWNGDPLVPLQVLNALTGAVALGLLWLLVCSQFEHEARGRLAAIGTCGLTGLSYGYWWYSVEVEVYLVSVLFLVLSLALAHRAVSAGTPLAFAALGSVNGLAVLAHVTNILFVVVAITALVMSRHGRMARLIRSASAYATAAIAVVLPAYIWAATSSGISTYDEARAWLNEYPSNDAWGNANSSAILKAVLGAGREVVGGHFAFSFTPAQETAARALAGSSLREEIYLVRSIPTLCAVVLTVLAGAVFVGVVALAARWLRRPTLPLGARQLALLCVAWAVPYALFFTWWEPENLEFWIATWVPVAVLLALPLGVLATGGWAPGPRTVAALLAGLFAANLIGSVLPQRHPSDDYWRIRLTWYESNVQAGDLVLAGDYLAVNYLDLYTPGEIVPTYTRMVGSRSKADVRRLLLLIQDRADAERVLVSNTALEAATQDAGSCTSEDCSIARSLRKYVEDRGRALAEGPQGEVVYEIARP